MIEILSGFEDLFWFYEHQGSIGKSWSIQGYSEFKGHKMRQVQPSQPPEALKQFPKTVENITCCPGVKSLQVQVGGMDVVTMAMIDMNTYISFQILLNAWHVLDLCFMICFRMFHDCHRPSWQPIGLRLASLKATKPHWAWEEIDHIVEEALSKNSFSEFQCISPCES